MSSSEPLIQIKVTCPLCKKTDVVSISQKDFEDAPSGIVRIPIEHTEPYRHLLVLDVDMHGFVRGAYLYKKIAKTTKYSISKIIDVLGIDITSNLLYYMLSRDKIFLVGSKNMKEYARQLIELMDEQQKLSTIREDGSPVKLEKNVKLRVAIHCLRQMIYQASRIPTDAAKYEWIKGEYGRLKEALAELRRIINKKKWKIPELLDALKTKITEDCLRLLIDILEEEGYKLRDKVKDRELKVKELFV